MPVSNRPPAEPLPVIDQDVRLVFWVAVIPTS